jgi:NADH:ubiquinone oxidoreductase subunit H
MLNYFYNVIRKFFNPLFYLSSGVKLFVKNQAKDFFSFNQINIIFILLILIGLLTVPSNIELTYLANKSALLILLLIAFADFLFIVMIGIKATVEYNYTHTIRDIGIYISNRFLFMLAIISIAVSNKGFGISDITISQAQLWNFIKQLPLFLMLGYAYLNEMPRARSEKYLLSAYHQNGFARRLIKFRFYFVHIFYSAIFSILFFGGLSGNLILKTIVLMTVFWFVKYNIPEQKLDIYLKQIWKRLIPVALVWLFLQILLKVLEG